MFKRKKSDKLSQKESDAALARIRKSYDDYIITYMTGIDEKTAFEDRYITALHARVDLTRFIKEEIEHLGKLKADAEADKARAAKVAAAAKIPKKTKKGFADMVMEELEKKIESYPELEFHEDASTEVKKLYGALGELDRVHWSVLASFIKRIHSSTLSYNLENRLLRMTSGNESSAPPDLDRYKFLLEQKGKYSSELFRESQECIKRASFFLHELKHILLECQDRGIMDEAVEAAFDYVDNIIADFRLKDLKRQ